jgi:hypothetical protein
LQIGTLEELILVDSFTRLSQLLVSKWVSCYNKEQHQLVLESCSPSDRKNERFKEAKMRLEAKYWKISPATIIPNYLNRNTKSHDTGSTIAQKDS